MVTGRRHCRDLLMLRLDAVFDGPLPQDFLGDGHAAMHAADEVHDVLWTGQQRQVAEDDDAVETMVCECQQVTKQFPQILPSVLPCA